MSRQEDRRSQSRVRPYSHRIKMFEQKPTKVTKGISRLSNPGWGGSIPPIAGDSTNDLICLLDADVPSGLDRKRCGVHRPSADGPRRQWQQASDSGHAGRAWGAVTRVGEGQVAMIVSSDVEPDRLASRAHELDDLGPSPPELDSRSRLVWARLLASIGLGFRLLVARFYSHWHDVPQQPNLGLPSRVRSGLLGRGGCGGLL
jgi:hypothetical protein